MLELACRAPSVHNSQPWLWRIVDETTIELYADRARQLEFSDPDGRNLMISCGAALHHALEAARAMGLAPTFELAPAVTDHDLLARIRLSRGRAPSDAVKRLQYLEQRCTDRRRFTSWPVPDSQLTALAQAAAGWGARGVPVTDVTARFRCELMLDRAMTLQASDARYADEQASWIERSRTDGVPATAAAPPRSSRLAHRPNRFAADLDTLPSPRLVESSDGLIAICTANDDQTAWLQTGQALSSLWLRATRAGLSIVPLSQVIEVAETRQALYDGVFAGMSHPQVLVRVGWQEIARATLPRTPRRPLDDVLVR